MKRDDFVGFTFNGQHSSDLGILSVSDGSRYQDTLVPTFTDYSESIPGVIGENYYGTDITSRTFSLSIAYDSLTETQVRKLRQWLAPGVTGKLIFDERPYKAYSAKIANPPSLSFICFDGEDGQRVYKGEGSIEFVCYYPYAQTEGEWKELDNYSTIYQTYIQGESIPLPFNKELSAMDGYGEIEITNLYGQTYFENKNNNGGKELVYSNNFFNIDKLVTSNSQIVEKNTNKQSFILRGAATPATIYPSEELNKIFKFSGQKYYFNFKLRKLQLLTSNDQLFKMVLRRTTTISNQKSLYDYVLFSTTGRSDYSSLTSFKKSFLIEIPQNGTSSFELLFFYEEEEGGIKTYGNCEFSDFMISNVDKDYESYSEQCPSVLNPREVRGLIPTKINYSGISGYPVSSQFLLEKDFTSNWATDSENKKIELYSTENEKLTIGYTPDQIDLKTNTIYRSIIKTYLKDVFTKENGRTDITYFGTEETLPYNYQIELFKQQGYSLYWTSLSKTEESSLISFLSSLNKYRSAQSYGYYSNYLPNLCPPNKKWLLSNVEGFFFYSYKSEIYFIFKLKDDNLKSKMTQTSTTLLDFFSNNSVYIIHPSSSTEKIQLTKDQVYFDVSFVERYLVQVKALINGIEENTSIGGFSTKESTYSSIIDTTQWAESSGLLQSLNLDRDDGFDHVITTIEGSSQDTRIKLYNPGDLPTDFILTFDKPINDDVITFSLNDEKTISLNLRDKITGDTSTWGAVSEEEDQLANLTSENENGKIIIKIDTQKRSIRWYDLNKNKEVTRQGPATFMWKKGDFFQIPISQDEQGEILYIYGTTIPTNISIEYSYLYY